MSFHYQGHGEHRLKAGDCHIIPPGRSHTVTGWSEDVELRGTTSRSSSGVQTSNTGEPIPG
jgi:mannose-6-phosphate isomerase-like protein (cupin superfamily)